MKWGFCCPPRAIFSHKSPQYFVFIDNFASCPRGTQVAFLASKVVARHGIYGGKLNLKMDKFPRPARRSGTAPNAVIFRTDIAAA
jgi:hypothetical protein